MVPDPMPEWTSGLESQSQPERGSRLPLVYCGWIPSSRDFGFLVDRVAYATLALPMWICASAQCVYPVGCQPYSIAFLCYLREPHMSMFPDVSQNCAFFFGFLFFGRRGDIFFPRGVSALLLRWKVLRLGSERSGRPLLVSASSEAQS